MQFIVVANDDLAPLGRQLAHALSVQKDHTGAFWTVKHYRDNEAQLGGKQPVIFLGDNEVANSYVDVLPQRFRAFGAKCAFEAAKAVLIAEEPESVSQKDIERLTEAVKGNQQELRQRAARAAARAAAAGAAAAAAGAGAGAAAGASLLAIGVAVTLWPTVVMGPAAWALLRYLSARKRKAEYRRLQYQYVLSRFLKDEFETYLGGIEGH